MQSLYLIYRLVIPVLLGTTLDVGTQPNSYGYGGTGKKSTARQFEDYGQIYGQVFSSLTAF